MRALLQPPDDRVERGARRLRVGAAQRIVGAELEDHGVGSFADRPVEPRQARPPRVSPDTPAFSIATASPLALSARSSLAGSASGAGKPEAGAERIAEHHDADRTIRGGGR